MSRRGALPYLAFLMFAVLPRGVAQAADATPRTIERATGPIVVDGTLSEPAWQQATKFETWYETNPGDNTPPKVKSVGYVTYDSKFLYIGIDLQDPHPSDVRAPFSEHDHISGNTDDFAGVIIDTRNDGKTGYEFFITARGVQYDAITSDVTGNEDSSPDFFWDSEARINDHGWSVEARIPFSSLRYDSSDPSQWHLTFYRNMPRDRRYQIFTSKQPRGSNCFVCNFEPINGLKGLPSGDHFVAAPYVTANQLGEPRDGLGTRVVNHPVSGDTGLDVKWNPTADMAVDATINPDFSQIESDVAVISTNERFAIFIPEKRPFFLEGVDLLSTPIQAVYTRTLTSPRWGGRTTGRSGNFSYTALVSQDRGGGVVILPSAFGSDFALQDFSSTVAIGRVRRDFGQSFVSFLGTTREYGGGGHNRVFGPDFQLRLGGGDSITGEVLFSDSETPNRPDVASEWDGRKLRGHAAYANWQHSTRANDFYINVSDYSRDFRADNGFVPQVDWRGSYAETGHTFRPEGFFSRVRTYAFGEYDVTQSGDPLYKLVSAGFGADGKHRSFTRLRYARDWVANAGQVFARDRMYYTLDFSPGEVFNYVSLDGWLGDDVDFGGNRPGRGALVNLSGTVRPSDHLQLSLTAANRWLTLSGNRLFTSQVERIRATYTFDARTFLRAIVQNQRTNRDTVLYATATDPHSGNLSGQLLFAYKVNWQTVFYVGVGDLREVTPEQGDFEVSSRQLFAKVSYAFQR